jgi:chemotaxis protein MotB
MHPALPAIAPAKLQDDVSALEERLRKALDREIAKKEVSLHIGPDGLVLSLRELGFFDSGSARIRPQAQPAFSRLAEILKDQPHRLRIEGHTDNIPIHTARFASNWELSTARSTEVVRLLITKYGFEPDRLSAAGYGEFHPVADNTTLEGRENNRRVDVVVLAENKN